SSEKLPKRVPPEIEVSAPEPEPRSQAPAGSCAHRPMVMADPFNEGPGFPTLHPRRGHGNPIDPASLDRLVAADFLETPAPEELACPGDVFQAGKSEVIASRSLDEWRSRHTELRIGSKLPQQEFEVVDLERDVGVQVSNDVVILVTQGLVASAEALDLRCKVAVSALGQAYQRNPRIVRQ